MVCPNCRYVASKSTQPEVEQVIGEGSEPLRPKPPETTDGQPAVEVPVPDPGVQPLATAALLTDVVVQLEAVPHDEFVL